MCEESKENSMPVATPPPTDNAVFNVYQPDDPTSDVDIDISCLLEEEAKAGNSGESGFSCTCYSFLNLHFRRLKFFKF